MRKIYLLALLFMVLIGSCKKDKPTAKTSSSNNVTSMTSMETALVGKWYWDSTYVYNGGVLTDIHLNTDSFITAGVYQSSYNNCLSSLYNNATAIQPNPQEYDQIWFVKDFGTSGVTIDSSIQAILWAVVPPNWTNGAGSYNPSGTKYQIWGDFGPVTWGLSVHSYIDTITSTHLILDAWAGSVPQGNKCFFHK
jgi:hypothetical protein